MGDAPATATVLPHRTVNHHVDGTYAANATATGSEYSRLSASVIDASRTINQYGSATRAADIAT